MSDLTPETLAELRRLLDAATPGPWRDEMMQGQGVTLTAIIAGKPNPDDLRVIGSMLAHNDARVLIAAVNALPALLDAAAERDALRTWQERVALAAGLADEVAGYGVHLEADPDTAAEHVAGLLDIADTHVECPICCGDCGEPLADTPCDHCGGSGCGPGTGSGAYEECGWCAGAGKVHVGCAHLSYAELCAERDALAAKLDAVRALHTPVRYYTDPCDDPECERELVELSVGDYYHADTFELMCEVCSGGDMSECDYDNAVPHPCPTVRALDATPETGGES